MAHIGLWVPQWVSWLVCYAIAATQESFTYAVTMSSSPAQSGFLTGHTSGGAQKPADCCWFPLGTARFPRTTMLVVTV